MINEHEQAILTTILPDSSLLPGDIGTVVHIYEGNSAYEIEFFTVDGQTLDVVTVEATHVRPVDSHAVFHDHQISA